MRTDRLGAREPPFWKGSRGLVAKIGREGAPVCIRDGASELSLTKKKARHGRGGRSSREEWFRKCVQHTCQRAKRTMVSSHCCIAVAGLNLGSPRENGIEVATASHRC